LIQVRYSKDGQTNKKRAAGLAILKAGRGERIRTADLLHPIQAQMCPQGLHTNFIRVAPSKISLKFDLFSPVDDKLATGSENPNICLWQLKDLIFD